MADVTVAQFAEVLKVPVEKLLSQLDEAGIQVRSSDDTTSDDAKLELLTYLRRSHGQADTPAGDAAPRRITLKRKSQSELKLSGAQGRSRRIGAASHDTPRSGLTTAYTTWRGASAFH